MTTDERRKTILDLLDKEFSERDYYHKISDKYFRDWDSASERALGYRWFCSFWTRLFTISLLINLWLSVALYMVQAK